MKKLLLMIAPAALALGIGVYFGLQKSGVRATAQEASVRDIALQDVQENLQQGSQWLGKAVVVNHWASWCPPCVNEIPLLIDFHQQYAARGVQVVGIAHDTKEAARIFGDQIGIEYPSLVIEMGGAELMISQGNKQGSALPFTAIFDRTGKLVSSRLGELKPGELEKAVLPLL